MSIPLVIKDGSAQLNMLILTAIFGMLKVFVKVEQ